MKTAAVILAVSVVAVALALLKVIPDYDVGLATTAAIMALFVMSLDLLSGFTGLESLGHASFFGTGAYVAAILALHGYDNALVAVAAGAVAATLLATAFAAIALRAIGPYFLIMTMALGYLPWSLAIKLRSFTGGDDGLSGLPRPQLFGFSLESGPAFFTFTLIATLVCGAIIVGIGRSSFGTTLRGIRGNASRMAALGYNVWLHKYACFLISAFFAGVAGALFAYYSSFVSPDVLGVGQSAEALVAMIVGGAGTMFGPALAAAVLMLLHSTVGSVFRYWNLLLGSIYIAVVLFAPNGVLAASRRLASGRRRA